MKGILRQFSIAGTLQQNGVAERRNRTLIKVARTMLADSKLPTTFWAEVVNTACYVQNRVLVVKPHNKTAYELFHGRTPNLRFMRPFECHVTILNTIDHLGKFDGKAFRVFNSRTRIVEENLHIRFSKSTPNVVGTKASDNASQARNETEPIKDYILLPLWTADPPYSQDPKSFHNDGSKLSSDDGNKVDEDPRKDSKCNDQEKEDNVNSTNNVNAASTNEVNDVGEKTSIKLPFDPNMHALKRISDKRTKNEAKTDKTEHGMEEREKAKVKNSRSKSTKNSTPTKSKVKAEADIEEMLNGPTLKPKPHTIKQQTHAGNPLVCDSLIRQRQRMKGLDQLAWRILKLDGYDEVLKLSHNKHNKQK
ncbi:ribonuclease H-like domain-containing protein [Tanacetum coccineum]